MELIPVLDIRQGVVIRGQAGQRELYQPNTSLLIDATEPLATCHALIRHFHPRIMYVADLDGIERDEPQFELIERLAGCAVELAVDAGIESLERGRRLLDLGVKKVIIGLETLPRIDMLQQFVLELGAHQVILSLDLFNGTCIGPDAAHRSPQEVAGLAVEAGIRQMIVLDLTQVGMSRGVSTLTLCHSIKNRWPDLVVWTGGGIRSVADLHRLSLNRLDGAMVASALHDGHITPSDWRSFVALSDDLTQMAMDA